jgi:hypothetical protein
MISIKYVKKASLWCKTTINRDDQGKYRQDQEWSAKKPKAKDD